MEKGKGIVRWLDEKVKLNVIGTKNKNDEEQKVHISTDYRDYVYISLIFVHKLY